MSDRGFKLVTVSTARRNLAAECRAVEMGHNARLDRARGVFVVVSDSVPGRTYELEALGIGGWLVVSCSPCPTSKREQIAGVMACKHRALVARRLEREGLVTFDGEKWRVTERAESLAEGGDAVAAAGQRGPAHPAPAPGWRSPPTPIDGARADACPACGERVDPYIEIPVQRQEVIVSGHPYHRGCLA